jgi:hypothetical protein
LNLQTLHRLGDHIKVKLGKSGRDNTIHHKGENLGNEKDCKECDELDLATLKNELTDTRKKVDDLTAQNKELTGKLEASEKKAKEAGDTLNQYREAEKKALLESIVKRSDFKPEDLKDKSVEELRTIHTTIDHVKPPDLGTVKNVRGAGDGASSLPANFTADGKIDITKSLVGAPKKGADGRVMRDAAGNVIWEVK